MRVIPPLFLVALLLAPVRGGAARVAAQESTPVAAAPSPDLCTLKPRTIADLETLASTPLPPATPVAVPDPFVMPDGDPLELEAQDEVEKDILRAIACFNTGDPLKILATYTDDWVRGYLVRIGELNDQTKGILSTPQPVAEADRVQLLGFGDAVDLSDDRIAIIVNGRNPATGPDPGQRLFYMEEAKPGRWLIDEIVELGTRR